MTGELEIRPHGGMPAVSSARQQWADELMAWAAAAQKAHEIATVLCETSFVPKSMQHRPGDVTGAILTGMELDVPIMWALANIDIVEGSPALRAKGLRGLLVKHGHEIWVEESTASRAVVCARHKNSSRIERSIWTLDRARKAELLGKKNWRLYAQDMLVNRATAEAARLAAPDVMFGVAYTVDELGGDETPNGGMPVVEEKAEAAKPARRTARRAKAEPPTVAPQDLPADIPVPDDPPLVVPHAMPSMVADVVDAVLPEPMPPTSAPTCDDNMPHDIRKPAPEGCPPNCPTRVAAERQDDERQAADEQEQTDAEQREAAAEDATCGDDQPVDAPAPRHLTDQQRKRMAVEMRRVGIKDRDTALLFVAQVIGRDVATRNDLTVDEASQVITALVAEGLDAVETRYDRGAEQ